MPHQSHGSGEIAWSKKGFAQPHTFQHRKCDHILEEWITMCLFSCPSIPPPDTTSHLTAMPLLGLGYIDSLPPPSNSVVHPHSLPTSAAYACLTDVPWLLASHSSHDFWNGISSDPGWILAFLAWSNNIRKILEFPKWDWQVHFILSAQVNKKYIRNYSPRLMSLI